MHAVLYQSKHPATTTSTASPHMHGSIVFARWRQCAPHTTHASSDPSFVSDIAIFVLKRDVKLQLTNQLTWAHPSLYPKQHLDWFSCFCTTHGRRYLCFTMGRPFPTSKLPLHMGDLDPHASLGPTHWASEMVQPLLQGS